MLYAVIGAVLEDDDTSGHSRTRAPFAAAQCHEYFARAPWYRAALDLGHRAAAINTTRVGADSLTANSPCYPARVDGGTDADSPVTPPGLHSAGHFPSLSRQQHGRWPR
jgi:hypothetical protein